jgi:hypothetical protein
MPSLTTDANGWLSNGAVQAPSPTHANGFVTNGVNGAHASNGTNATNATNGTNGTNGTIGKSHRSTYVAFDDVPVLIIGGGPTGLLLAYLLSKLNGSSRFFTVPHISI